MSGLFPGFSILSIFASNDTSHLALRSIITPVPYAAPSCRRIWTVLMGVRWDNNGGICSILRTFWCRICLPSRALFASTTPFGFSEQITMTRLCRTIWPCFCLYVLYMALNSSVGLFLPTYFLLYIAAYWYACFRITTWFLNIWLMFADTSLPSTASDLRSTWTATVLSIWTPASERPRLEVLVHLLETLFWATLC